MKTILDFSHVKNVLCLGAHCDDIEIGAGALLMRLVQQNPKIHITCAVFTGGDGLRAEETKQALAEITKGCAGLSLTVHDFKDAFLPTQVNEIKPVFEQIKQEFEADLILTHYEHDKHQDHRVINELTYNTWRNHNILEFEILKWDGDLGKPNVYVSVPENIVRKKTKLVYESFVSQRNKSWFSEETLRALMRVRGVECNAEYAEAFYTRKLVYG